MENHDFKLYKKQAILPFILSALIFLCLEFIFSWLLTGTISFRYERKSLLLSAVLSALILNFYPLRKYKISLWIPLLIAVSSLAIRPLSGESVSPAECYQYIGLFTGTYGLLFLIYLFLPQNPVRKVYLFLSLFLFLMPAGLLWFYYFVSGSWPHADTMMAVLQTNPAEAWSYLKDHFHWIGILCTLFVLGAFYFFLPPSSGWRVPHHIQQAYPLFCCCQHIPVPVFCNSCNTCRKTKPPATAGQWNTGLCKEI